MERWRGKIVVVTGASAGIGLATAKALIQQGMIVIGLARRKDKMLKEMGEIKESSGKFYAKECDVSNESSVAEAFEYIKKTFNTLHILINNAGIIAINTIENAEVTEMDQIIKTNLNGPIYCFKHAVKLMKENNDEGYIININSVAGHKVPNPTWFKGDGIFVNVYPATKFGLTALSESFRSELLGNKIRVTNLSPGYVITEIFEEGALDEAGLQDNPSLKPEDIANSIVYIIGTPTHVQITELTIKPLGEPF